VGPTQLAFVLPPWSRKGTPVWFGQGGGPYSKGWRRSGGIARGAGRGTAGMALDPGHRGGATGGGDDSIHGRQCPPSATGRGTRLVGPRFAVSGWPVTRASRPAMSAG